MVLTANLCFVSKWTACGSSQRFHQGNDCAPVPSPWNYLLNQATATFAQFLPEGVMLEEFATASCVPTLWTFNFLFSSTPLFFTLQLLLQ